MKQFLAKNRFALGVAAAWLVVVWGGVLGAQALHGLPLSLAAWGGDWDAGWYQSIVQGGYYSGTLSAQQNLAFFPLYPLTVWLVHTLTFLPVVWAGMLVSVVCFTAALAVIYQFVLEFFNRRIARMAVLLLAFNPFSFYFGMMYTEALFVLLAALTLLFLWRKQWWVAALAAGLASGTRSVGVALGVMVVVAWIFSAGNLNPPAFYSPFRPKRAPLKLGNNEEQKAGGLLGAFFYGAKRKKWGGSRGGPTDRTPVQTKIIPFFSLALLSFSGLILFSLYLWWHNGDPIAYSHAQSFWPGRGGINNVGVELHYLFAHKVINKEYLLTVMWYISAIVGFAGLGLLLAMRQYSMAIFAAIALSLPIIYGTAGSLNRYVQVVIPVFIAYGALLQKWPAWAKGVVLALCIVTGAAAIFVMTGADHPFLG